MHDQHEHHSCREAPTAATFITRSPVSQQDAFTLIDPTKPILLCPMLTICYTIKHEFVTPCTNTDSGETRRGSVYHQHIRRRCMTVNEASRSHLKMTMAHWASRPCWISQYRLASDEESSTIASRPLSPCFQGLLGYAVMSARTQGRRGPYVNEIPGLFLEGENVRPKDVLWIRYLLKVEAHHGVCMVERVNSKRGRWIDSPTKYERIGGAEGCLAKREGGSPQRKVYCRSRVVRTFKARNKVLGEVKLSTIEHH